MHPNVFLKTLWRTEFKPQIFVAMQFSPEYLPRYENIIKPAIEGITFKEKRLSAVRTDVSKSGDSILTEIMDGIAHSEMVLADVSTAGRDSKNGKAYRNSNVFYEVGVALACRQPQEVVLIRDDEDDFLFDVSTIPRMKIDFSDVEEAKKKISEELVARLNERTYVEDVRVQMAIASLDGEAIRRLRNVRYVGEGNVWGPDVPEGAMNWNALHAIPRLLDLGLIRLAGTFEDGVPAYRQTRLGHVVAQSMSNLPKFTSGVSLDKDGLPVPKEDPNIPKVP